MPSQQRILVPLDGSTLAEQAVGEAALFSKLPNTEVILLQVIPPIEDVITSGAQEIGVDAQWELQKVQGLRYLRSIQDDVIVRHVQREDAASSSVFLLGTVSSSDQFIVSTRAAAAVSRPLAFARRLHVRAWVVNDADLNTFALPRSPRQKNR